MACVLVDKEELKKIKSSKYISSGDEGTCYLYNNLVFKIYHYLKYNRQIYFDLENSNYIAFPEDILVSIDTKEIIGYTMKKLNGMNLKNGFDDNLKINDLKKAYKVIKQEIEKFSYINMDNISLMNTLYDYSNNHINLIDTSLWTLNVDSTSNNIEKLNHILITSLAISLDWNRYKLNSNQKLFDLYGMYLNNNSYFLEFLTELEIIVSERNQNNVKTIKNLMIK